jgi:ribonucleotide reductase class II
VFFSKYSHNQNGKRETWKEVCDRTVRGIKLLGKLTDEEAALIWRQQYDFQCLVSGRSLWTSGREWIEQPANFPGAYNCTSLQLTDLQVFGLLMDLAMMGCGTGAVLTKDCIEKLPKVQNRIAVETVGVIGLRSPEQRRENTKIVKKNQNFAAIRVGDSRKGWVDAYQGLIDIAFDPNFKWKRLTVFIDLSSVRPAGEQLKGFGGIANPIKLPDLFSRVAEILNGAVGRQLNSLECCLLIDEGAACIVAGNIRRTAGIRQFSMDDELARAAKDNLWQQTEEGGWAIDPKRDALRMANHTLVFDRAPTLEECVESVRKQHLSGEGAIQWEGEAVARGNSDLWQDFSRTEFLEACKLGQKEAWFRKNLPNLSEEEFNHRSNRFGLNPCGK